MKSIKAALLGATFLLGAGGAHAADLGGSLKDEPVYAPYISWTGFYLGGHLGGSFGDEIKWRNLSDDIDGGFLGGVQVGYNHQTGNLVLGVEADLSASGAEYTNYFASIRGRIGVTADRALFYATGGVAFLGWEDDVLLVDPVIGTYRLDDSAVGWTAGLGFDYKLNQKLSFGVEGLYYAFNDDVTTNVDYDRDFWTVRARINYHFGGGHESLK